jgi:protein involved in polysaccharide export with SLBB domain
MKPVLLVLGIFALAVLGAGAVKNREPIKVASRAVVAHDQPALATAESSRGAVPAPDASNASATLVEPNAAPAAPTTAELPKTVSPAPDAPSAPAAGLFGVGDRLKIAFYERLDVEEDKWGRASSASALRSIMQRPELSGEYAVQVDGTISVPLLGSIPVANRSAQQVHADLEQTFEQLLGRKGLVNILSLERSPIYVLGPVRNPGSFNYAPGMTVLHAIALAGGLDRGAGDPWQKIEAVRENPEAERGGRCHAEVVRARGGAEGRARQDGTQDPAPAAETGRRDRGRQPRQRAERSAQAHRCGPREPRARDPERVGFGQAGCSRV